MVTEVAKAAGIPRHISPHSLRHAAITNAVDAGVPRRDARILARHTVPRTTEHCDRARGNPEDLAELEEPLAVLSDPTALADIREADTAYAAGDVVAGWDPFRPTRHLPGVVPHERGKAGGRLRADQPPQ